MLGIEFLFCVRKKKSVGDDFPVATLLGITLLDSTGDNLPESTEDNSSNSTGDIFYTPLGMIRIFSADGR